MIIDIKQFKCPYDGCNQYVAPYRYSFFRGEKNLGRIIWENNVNGVYLDRNDEEWGL